MPILPAPFTTITPEATLEALNMAGSNSPADFLRKFTISPLLMYPSSHAVLVPVSACSMARYNRATMLGPDSDRLAEYFAMNDGANWRGDLVRNWAVGIVRTGMETLPREYDSEEPLITITTADGLTIDVYMGGHRITATGSAGTILRAAGKHAIAERFDFFPMYLFVSALSGAVTSQFLTEMALLDNLGHDLARINDPSSTVLLVMTALVEKCRSLDANPLSAKWNDGERYVSLWTTLNTVLECSPDDDLDPKSEKRPLRNAMVDVIRNVPTWLPLLKLLTDVVPCTAKPGFKNESTVLRQTSTLKWLTIVGEVLDMHFQPVTMWSAMDAVQVHIACGNPFVTNADVYSKIGPADDNTGAALFDQNVGLCSESHGLLVNGGMMREGFHNVRLNDNRRFSTFISLADMGKFRRWDHGFVSAVGCFALAQWLIFGTKKYNIVSVARRMYRKPGVRRPNGDTDNYCEYLKAHTPSAFFDRLYRMAKGSTDNYDIAHFPIDFWTELLTPSKFTVPPAYIPPTVKMPTVMTPLIWGRDRIPVKLGIFPGFGAGLIHALHTFTTSGNSELVDGFGGLFHLLDPKTVLMGIRDLKTHKMVPADLPDLAGTRWKTPDAYIPPAPTSASAADPPAPPPARVISRIASIPVPALTVSPPRPPVSPLQPPPVPAASDLFNDEQLPLATPTVPAASDLFNDEQLPLATPTPDTPDLFAEFSDDAFPDDEDESAMALVDVPSVGESEPGVERETAIQAMTPVEADVGGGLVPGTSEEDVPAPLSSPAKSPDSSLEIALPDIAGVAELEPEVEREPGVQDVTPVEADVGAGLVAGTPDEDMPSPLSSPAKSPANLPSLVPTEPLTDVTQNNAMASFPVELDELYAHAGYGSDDWSGENVNAQMQRNELDPTTPPNEASGSNVLGSPFSSPGFVEEEEVDIDAYITILMTIIRGTPDHDRILEDMKAVAFARCGSQITVPKLTRRIPKRSHSTATSAVVSPAVGRVTKKMREDEQ
ncbi:hypothetical protein BDZ89DRAFT_1071928 [Hymenopellis radicata]|nr:hypothetical protein BDZ89DRAFT_1071928 [Hymenopellis radicata]